MRSKSFIALAGTVITAILASSCCIAPLILTGLGIGSAGVFPSLWEYRPLFIIITLALIGAAFYFTYRKKGDTKVCCNNERIRIKKIALWVIAGIAICLLLFPYFYLLIL